MYSSVVRVRSIHHAEQQLRHRLDKNNSRKRKRRRTDVFRLLLKSQAWAYPIEQVIIVSQEERKSTTINEEEASLNHIDGQQT